jgi:Family of unknown function (DUF6288)/Bacterial Ig domain/Divergent InlB B-repeat domain/Bacterial Ig-like domain/HEAT repeats
MKKLRCGWMLVLSFVFAMGVSTEAHDLTAGDVMNSEYTHNLGPTGMRGWVYISDDSSWESRQILVLNVASNSPAFGVMQVKDVILGVNGTGAAATPFTNDARKAFAYAIGDAEARNPANLRLIVWRPGTNGLPATTNNLQITLQTMGAYSPTAPYNCPKSAKILQQGLDFYVARLNQDDRNIGIGRFGALALMASTNAAHHALAKEYVEPLADIDPLQMQKMMSGESSPGAPWGKSYELITLAEYYLQTGDTNVFPALQARATEIARHHSLVGTTGHGFAAKHADGSDNGQLGGYGPVNVSSLSCFLGLVLAYEGGVTNQYVKGGIERCNRFFGYFAGKGVHVYGEGVPEIADFSSNGKSGLAALCFSRQTNRVAECRYFARTSGSDIEKLERAHTGPLFKWFWEPLGANVGGEESMASYFSQIRWHLDLLREWNGGFSYDKCVSGKNGNGVDYGASSGSPFVMEAVALLTYATGNRQLRITGCDPRPENQLTSAEVAETKWSANYFQTPIASRSNAELIANLSDWAPPTGYNAALELVNRTVTPSEFNQIVALAMNTNAIPIARASACTALGEIGDPAALPTLVAALTDSQNDVRRRSAMAIGRFTRAQVVDGGYINAILAAAVSTAGPTFPLDEDDPLHFANGAICEALFDAGGGVLRLDMYTGVDTNLLYPAIEATFAHPYARVRGNSAAIWEQLTYDGMLAVCGAAIDATLPETPTPGDWRLVYYPSQEHVLRLLEKWHIAEGIPLALMVGTTPPAKSKDTAWDVIGRYGGACASVTPNVDVLPALYACKDGPPPAEAPYGAEHARDAIASILHPANTYVPTPLKSITSIGAARETLTLLSGSVGTTLRVTGHDYAKAASIYTWRMVHGACAVAFTPNGTAASTNTSVTMNMPGIYCFEVTMSDFRGLTEAIGQVTVTVYNASGQLPANSAPTAVPQRCNGVRNQDLAISLIGHDPEGLPMGFALVTPPQHGDITFASYGSSNVTYHPDYLYSGRDSFVFKVIDSDGLIDTATVDIAVNGDSVALNIYEPFDYPAGAMAGASGSTELGLTGAWTHAYGPGGEQIAPGSLSHGSVLTFSNHANADRSMIARPLAPGALSASGLLDDGATLWFSVLSSWEDFDDISNTGKKLLLATDTPSGWTSIANNGCAIGLLQENKYVKAVAWTTNGVVEPSGSGRLYEGKSCMIVGKFTWGATPSDQDQLELYAVQTEPVLMLNEAPFSRLVSTFEETNEVVLGTSAIVDQKQFDTLILSGYGMDEIRFGSSLESVLIGETKPPLVADLSPANGEATAPTTQDATITFDEPISLGTGVITVTNLTDRTSTVIDVENNGGLLDVAGPELRIDLPGDFEHAHTYAILIEPGAIVDFGGHAFAGFTNTTGWSFTCTRYYPLTYTAGPNGGISGPTNQSVSQGADGSEVTAVPNAGYKFMVWSDGRTHNPRIDTAVSNAVSVTAFFSTDPVAVASQGAVPVTITSAEISGVLTDGGAAAGWLCWGPTDGGTTSTGNWAHVVSIGAITEGVAFSNLVTGLDFHTVYVYRFYAESATGSDWSDSVKTFSGSARAWTAEDLDVIAWYDASDVATVLTNSSGVVTQWLEKSGQVVNLTASGNPRRDVSTINGKSVIDFDGNGDYAMGTIPMPASRDLSMFAVARIDAGGTYVGLIGIKDTVGSIQIRGKDSNFTGEINVSDIMGDGRYAMSLGGPYINKTNIFNMVVDNTADTLAGFVSGTNKASRTITGSIGGVTRPFYVAMGNNSNNCLNSAVGEVIIIEDTSPGTRQMVEGYLAHKWGVAAQLPSDHPYKAAPPGAGPTYTITASAGSGGSIMPSGAVVVDKGNNQGFTISPNTGYRVAAVTVDGGSIGATNSYIFSNVAIGHTISATFVLNQYTLTYTAGANGSISGTKTQTVNHGASGTQITAVPNAGYVFLNWSDGRRDNPRRDTSVTGPITVTANFAVQSLVRTITASGGPGGSIAPSGAVAVVKGSAQTFTMTPDTGYSVTRVVVDGASVGGASSYTFSNVATNHTIAATFAINQYTLNYTVGGYGTVIGTLRQTVSYCADGTAVTAVPEEGFVFVNWSDGSTNNPRRDVAVTKNIAVTATFAPDYGWWTPALAAPTAWYDASDAGTVVVNGSNTVTQWLDKSGNGFHMSAESGFEPDTGATIGGLNALNFARDRMAATVPYQGGTQVEMIGVFKRNWYVHSTSFVSVRDHTAKTDSGVASGCLFANDVEGDLQGCRVLEKSKVASPADDVPYIFGSAFDGANNTVYLNGTAAAPVSSTGQFHWDRIDLASRYVDSAYISPASVKIAEVVILTNATDVKTRQRIEGYLAHKWGLEADLPAGHPYKTRPPIHFRSYTITASAGPGGSIAPSGAVVVDASEDPTFAITPNTGYSIVNVVVDSAAIGATNSYTFTHVVTNHTIAVTFDVAQYTLTYAAGANGRLSGTTTQTVSYGTAGTAVTALPDGNCEFVGWSDGRMDNPRTDTGVTNDITVTANFLAWTPKQVPNVIAWYDATDANTVLQTNGVVTQWNDKRGGFNLIGNGDPQTGTRTINGKNVIETDLNDGFSNGTFTVAANGNFSVFLVAALNGADGSNDSLVYLRNTISNTYDCGIQAGSTAFSGTLVGGILSSSGALTGGPYGGTTNLWNLANDSSSVSVLINGVTNVSRTVNGTRKILTPALFYVADRGLSAPNQRLAGAFGEVLVVSNMTVETRQKIEGYLAHKWGQAAKLPADHPYKAAPPGEAKTNTPPVANAQSVTTAEDTAKAITLIGSDVDGDALTYTIVTQPAHGTLSGTGASRTYTPAANYNGADSFTFKVNDGTVDSAVATVSITVTAVNDAPVANAGADQTVPLVAGTVEEPVSGACYEWDAAQDLDGNNTWTSTTTNSYTWTFDSGSLSPVKVADARLNRLTHAYAFPAAKDASNTSWSGKGDTQPATFEFVIDVDGANGSIFETGASTDGLQVDIVNGILRGTVAETTPARVSYQLTAEDMGRFIHVVFVADNANNVAQLYVDGALKDSQPWTAGEDWSGTDNSSLGGTSGKQVDGGSTAAFNGKMALFRYYRNKAFTTAEVTMNFNALSVDYSATVNLAGTVGDPDGTTPTAFWSVVSTVPAGMSVEFGNPAAPVTTANFTQAGTYTLRLTADDGQAQASSNVIITVTGGAPTAVTASHAVPYAWLSSINSNWSNDYEAAASNDVDGDGFTTWQEYWSGTDPQDSNSSLKIDSVELSGGNLIVKWRHAAVDAGIPPITIQARSNLVSGSWVGIGSHVPTNGVNIWSAGSSVQGFYRLAVTNAP